LRDNNHSELRADGQAFGKESLNAIGRGVGGHIEISRLAAKQDIAHAPADQVGLVACRFQLRANSLRELPSFHGAIMREKRGRGKFVDCERAQVDPRRFAFAQLATRRTRQVMSSCWRA